MLIGAGFTADLQAQSTLIPLATRRDMVFDHGGRYLYITTSDGYVRAYNLSTQQLEPGYYLGGSLNGIDIAPDDSFLLVAQNNLRGAQVIIHRLNLITGALTNIGFTPWYGEAANGAWDVAIASNGLAMVTSAWGGSGFSSVRQIDLSTNTISLRDDVPGDVRSEITAKTQIHRSADGKHLSFLEADISSGPIFQYDATTDKFGIRVETETFTDSAGAAVSRDGSLLGTRLAGNGAALDTASNLGFIHTFHDPDGGIAFDAKTDTLYGVSSASDQIVAYDIGTYVEKFRLEINEQISAGVVQFGSGNLVASQDGRYVALATASGIRLFALPPAPSTPPSTPIFGTPRDIVFDHAGRYLYIATAEGFVWPYNLSTGVLESPFNLGGSIAGLDIAIDDSFLLVAQVYSGIAEGAFQKVDLNTGGVTNITYSHTFTEWGGCNVAIASNGLAFVTTGLNRVNWAPLRKIDLTTNGISECSGVPGSGPAGMVTQGTRVHRSADRTLLFFLEVDNSSGPIFTYNATSNTFGSPFQTNWFLDHAGAAVNRNGQLLSTRYYPDRAFLINPSNFNLTRTFDYLDAGIVFDSLQDTLYGVNSSNDQIVAYDTNTFVEKFRFDIGEDVSAGVAPTGAGTFVASQDGHHLALITPTAVRVYGVPAVQLISVVSDKTHGSAGIFDINLPLDGPRAVECRSGGANGQHRLIFTFGLPLTSIGGVTVSKGAATVAHSQVDSNDPHRYIVDLTGVVNAQNLKITLTDVFDSAGAHTASISQQFGVLVGDTTGNGLVNSSDIAQTQSQSGQPVGATNFREDVTVNGTINSSDIALVQSLSGSAIGSAPITYASPTPEPASAKARTKRSRK